MVLFFYVVLNIIAVFLFTKIKKMHLHSLEILLYWLLGSYLFQNFSALCYMNFATLIVPEKLSFEYAHFINRIVLYPVLMVFFLHYYAALSTMPKKLMLFGSFMLLFLGLEWLADVLGILIHDGWKTWWSFSFWFAALILLVGSMKLFRKILYNGGLKQ